MQRIVSQIRTSAPEYEENRRVNETLVAELEARLAQVRRGGTEKARQRHLSRGKLLPRERVEGLLDPGSPFLELSPLAAWEMYGGEAPSAGVITGIGRI